jgi:hypothetical protein
MGVFVNPDVVRLPLTEGQWIEVKKRLNAGESRKMFARVVKDMEAGSKPKLDPEQVGLTKLIAYLVNWSFADDSGKPVKYSIEALDSLDPDVYAEMVKAVDAHEDAQEAEREKEKNGIRNGESASSATLPLPSDAAGVLSGSAN